MLPRKMNHTRQRILAEFAKGQPLSKYDLEVRCHIDQRNVTAYLRELREEGLIHLHGTRRDTPHGPATKLWANGSGEDAKKPEPKHINQLRREQRAQPEKLAHERHMERQRRQNKKVKAEADAVLAKARSSGSLMGAMFAGMV